MESKTSPCIFRYLLYPRLLICCLVNLPDLSCFSRRFNPLCLLCASFLARFTEYRTINLLSWNYDTINLFLGFSTRKDYETVLYLWIQSVAEITDSRVVNIDGKRLRNNGVNGKKALFTWSAPDAMLIIWF